MEQQTLSIAKAGLVTNTNNSFTNHSYNDNFKKVVKLNTRATVIACCNPKGYVKALIKQYQ